MVHLPVEKDLLPLQVVFDLQQLRAVLRQLRRVVHDGRRRVSGVGHQVGHAHVFLHHSLAQRLHVGLNVAVFHVAAVLAYGFAPQLFHVPQHYGRLLTDAHFALQLLHPLLQCAVAAGQYRALPFQVPHLLFNVRCAPQLITNIRVAGGGEVIHVLYLPCIKSNIGIRCSAKAAGIFGNNNAVIPVISQRRSNSLFCLQRQIILCLSPFLNKAVLCVKHLVELVHLIERRPGSSWVLPAPLCNEIDKILFSLFKLLVILFVDNIRPVFQCCIFRGHFCKL